MEIKDVVYKEISDLAGFSIDDIKEDSDFVNDLVMDSLDVLELIMKIESRLNISINEEKLDIENLTVNSILKLIEDEQV